MPSAWEPKIFILIPYTGSFSGEWMFSFLNLVRPPGTDIRLSRGMPLPEERNQLVRTAIEGGGTHVLFLDSDIIPPSNALAELANLNAPITSGVYWTHQAVPTPSAWMATDNGRYSPIDVNQDGNVVSVDAVGMGFCLIDISVFQHVKKPWFKWTAQADRMRGVSEDFYFCRKARKAGYQILVRMDVKCAHIGVMRLNEDGSVGTMRF